MLRRNRFYRMVRTSFLIFLTAARYLWLNVRSRMPWIRPTRETWDRAHARTARGIYRLATRLGGVFVKLGQVFAARSDFFPPSFVEPLTGLHDRVPPRPFASLRRHIEHELGRPLADVFAEVDEEPIAAASLAQVHRARLLDGEEVVIKVQYPEARRLFPVDLASLRRGARVVRWFNRSLDPRPLADELAAFIRLELDFEREGQSTSRIRAAFGDDPRVRVPRVFHEHSQGRVLVLELLEGIRITDVAALDAAGFDRRAIAERVASIYASMIFEHGFFHGDPHPGNLLVLPDGAIGLLDFGLAKELPPGFAAGVARMIVAAFRGDGAAALAGARALGFELAADDPSLLLELNRMLMGDYDGPRSLVNLLDRGDLRSVPPHFTLIVRTMVILNGLSHILVPGERVIATALVRSLVPLVFQETARPLPETPGEPPPAEPPIGTGEPPGFDLPGQCR